MSDSSNPPLTTHEVDLVSTLILLGDAKLTDIRPAPASRTRLLQFELSDPTPRARQLTAEWQAHRWAGTSPELKTTSTLPVSLICRISPASRTIMHFLKTGSLTNCSHLVPEIETALLALPRLPSGSTHA